MKGSVTLSVKDLFFFNKNTHIKYVYCGKNVGFSAFQNRNLRVNVANDLEIWTDSIPVPPLPPTPFLLLPFLLYPVWFSEMCFWLSVPALKTLNTPCRHIFLVLKNRSEQTVIPPFFPPHNDTIFSPQIQAEL